MQIIILQCIVSLFSINFARIMNYQALGAVKVWKKGVFAHILSWIHEGMKDVNIFDTQVKAILSGNVRENTLPT